MRLHYSVLLSLIIWDISICKPQKKEHVSEFTKDYESQLIASENAEIFERNVTKAFVADYQVALLSMLTDFRVQVMLHKQHALKDNGNDKWIKFLNGETIEIENLEENYKQNEEECLKYKRLEINNKKRAIKQIVKEVKKWRKSFRYLVKLCTHKDDAAVCLQEYMKNDNFDQVIIRLLTLLKGIQKELTDHISLSLETVRNCLKNIFSKYMEDLRELMKNLNNCYERSLKFENAVNVPKEIIDITKLKCYSNCL